MQTFREIASFVIGLIVWGVCIFGPLMLLFARMPSFAIVASASSIAAYALSFRWRNGYVLILGCLGMMLLLYNTLTLCIASALIANHAGLSAPVQIGIGAAGIPIVIALVQGIERSANYLFGPAAPDCEIGTSDQSDGG